MCDLAWNRDTGEQRGNTVRDGKVNTTFILHSFSLGNPPFSISITAPVKKVTHDLTIRGDKF